MSVQFDPILGDVRDGAVSLAEQIAGFSAGTPTQQASFQASVSGDRAKLNENQKTQQAAGATTALLTAAKNALKDPAGGADIPLGGSGAVPRFIRPLYFNRLGQESPQCAAASGIGNTAGGDARWNVTMTAGSNVLAYTGGTAIADAGTGNFAGVLLVNGKYSIVNVLAVAGNAITVAQVMTGTGPAVLGGYFDAVNGQHLSPMGGYALADLLCNADPYSLSAGASVFSANSVDGGWHQQPWVSPFKSPEYWGPFGGIAYNQLNYNGAANIFNSALVVFTAGVKFANAVCSAVGHGLSITVPVGGAATVEVYTGSTAPGAELIWIAAVVDGTEVYRKSQTSALRGHTIPVSGGSVEIQVTSGVAAALSVVVSGVSVKLQAPVNQRAVERGDVILPIGDSWTTSTFPTFVQGVRDYAEANGASVLSSVGVGGTAASYALAVVGGTRRIDSWLAAAKLQGCTKALIHYYINDLNAGTATAIWAANLAEIERTCISAGVVPLFVLPGATASASQTQSLAQYYAGRVGKSVALKSLTRCTATELAGAAMFANTVGKYAGRVLGVPGVGTYIARGPLPADPWDCITAGVTPATVTPA